MTPPYFGDGFVSLFAQHVEAGDQMKIPRRLNSLLPASLLFGAVCACRGGMHSGQLALSYASAGWTFFPASAAQGRSQDCERVRSIPP
jgi:hypothetical protein